MNDLEAALRWKPAGGTFRLDATLRLGPERGVLFGPSGAGKSSILRLIAGLAQPEHGLVRLGEEVLFDSHRHVNRPLRRRRIGLIFQDDLLFPHLTVAGNVGFGLKRRRGVESTRRVAEVASLCGIERLLARMPATLSGGERQRVGLARALAPRPRLLLCDEPLSALDLPARDVLIDVLKTVQQAEAIPLLSVTHSPAEALALGTRLFLLSAGGIVDEGAPLDVLGRARGIPLDGLENRFAAVVDSQLGGAVETRLRLPGGPSLVVPRLERPVGSTAVVRVRADDILLASGPVTGLSARNVLAATVVRVVEHGSDAEVIVRTGEVDWMVSVVATAVRDLGLCAGTAVYMIVKARSCRVWAESLAGTTESSTDDTDGHR